MKRFSIDRLAEIVRENIDIDFLDKKIIKKRILNKKN
jgi:hypothetical protein